MSLMYVQLRFNLDNPIDLETLALFKAADVTKDGKVSSTAVKYYLYKSLHNKDNWKVMKSAKPLANYLPL